MSQGPGTAQRAVEAAFADRPEHRFTLTELCGVVYPDTEAHTPTQRKTVAKAAAKVARRTGWVARRVGSNRSSRVPQATIYVNPARAADHQREAREALAELGASPCPFLNPWASARAVCDAPSAECS